MGIFQGDASGAAPWWLDLRLWPFGRIDSHGSLPWWKDVGRWLSSEFLVLVTVKAP